MIFTLTEDTNPVIESHVMYNLEPKPAVPGLWHDGFRITVGTAGKPGDRAVRAARRGTSGDREPRGEEPQGLAGPHG